MTDRTRVNQIELWLTSPYQAKRLPISLLLPGVARCPTEPYELELASLGSTLLYGSSKSRVMAKEPKPSDAKVVSTEPLVYTTLDLQIESQLSKHR